MPAAKRRKVTATASKFRPSSVGAMAAFTKVSKPQLVSLSLHEKGNCSVTTQLIEEPSSDRKRKVPVVEDVKTDHTGDEAFKLLPGQLLKGSRTLPNTPKNP